MKKIVSLLMVLVLCIACISAPAYAEDLDTPETPIDIDEYVIRPSSGSTSFSVFTGCSITISVDGDVTYDNSNHPVSFSLSDCSGYLSYDNGFGYCSVSYSGYNIIGPTIKAYVNYSVYYQDMNGVEHTTSGSTTVYL